MIFSQSFWKDFAPVATLGQGSHKLQPSMVLCDRFRVLGKLGVGLAGRAWLRNTFGGRYICILCILKT